jgi:integrase
MRQSSNPRSVQDQLGHASPAMTMLYWRTLNRDKALKVQEGVDFAW